MKKLFIVIIGFIVFGCSQSNREPHLEEIYEIVSDNPEKAMAMLDSVNPKELSGSDRHFYDLLTIKAADKAYIRHTSDSLILDVIKYYAGHKKEGLYPEALYYGGRVYSDLGDLPTSITYFQQALDNLPKEMKGSDLEVCILSQTGRLLEKLGLFSEAIPYVERAIKLSQIRKDTLGIVYDLQLLTFLYTRQENYTQAEETIKKTFEFKDHVPSTVAALSNSYLADIKYELGQYDSALMIIRGLPDKVSKSSRNSALFSTSNIYLENGITDTAYLCAREIVESSNINQKTPALFRLLTPPLRQYSDTATIWNYLNLYLYLKEQSFNSNEAELAMMQQSLYNYDLAQRERLKAESGIRKLRVGLVIAGFVILFTLVAILVLKLRNQKAMLKLHAAIDYINLLRARESADKITLPETWEENREEDAPEKASGDTVNKAETEPQGFFINQEILREKLRQELNDLYEKTSSWKPDERIRNSPVYEEIAEAASQNRGIAGNDRVWSELEKIVSIVSPNFRQHLKLLTGRKISNLEYQTAMLLKGGFNPTEISIVTGRSKGAISYRREKLSTKIFGTKADYKKIDGIIRLL